VKAPSAWHAANETYALVTLNYKSVARIGLFPLLIIGSVQTLYAIYPNLLNLLITVFGNLAAAGMFAMGLQQMVAKSVQHQMYRFRFGHRYWRVAAAVMLALIPIIFMAMGILALGYVLAQIMLSPSLLGVVLLVGIVAALALAAYTAVRFSVIMPAIALDEPIDLQSAIRATRGRAWQLWRGLLATLSPVLIITVMLAIYAGKTGASAWAASSLQGFTVITAVPLSVVFLTLSYFRYVRKSAKPKMKIIGEPAWHLRAWYEVQRVFLFVGKVMAAAIAAMQPKPKPQPQPQPVQRPRPATRRAPVSEPMRPMRAAHMGQRRAAPAPTDKDDLARRVAEKLANLEEEKLAKLAEILDVKEAPASAAAAPAALQADNENTPRPAPDAPSVAAAASPAMPQHRGRAASAAARAAELRASLGKK
jgi:hypothetical protein